MKKLIRKLHQNWKDMATRTYVRLFGHESLDDMNMRIGQFPEGSGMQRFLKDHAVQTNLQITMPTQAAGRYTVNVMSWNETVPEMQFPQIYLNATHDRKSWACNIFHEARHLAQVYEAGMLYPKTLCPVEDYVWMDRVLEADAQAHATEMMYRWHKETNKTAEIDCLKNGDSGDFYGEMYRSFEQAIAENPENLDNGVARRRAFDTWFSTRIYDEYNYDVSAAMEKIPQWLGFLDKYAPDLEVREMTVDDLSPLGCVTFGTEPPENNYLTLPGFLALDDPFYKGDMNSTARKELKMRKTLWQDVKKLLQKRHGKPQNSKPKGGYFP